MTPIPSLLYAAAMRPLAEEERLAIERLHRRESVDSTLHQLAARADFRVVPAVFGLILQGDPRFDDRAAEALASIVARTRAHHFLDLDLLLRGDALASISWTRVNVDVLERLSRLPHATTLLGLAASSAHGRLREAVLEQLSNQSDDASIPFVLVRLNDWVPDVRRAALSALTPFLDPSRASLIVRNLPLVERLRRCGRVENGVLDRVEAVVASSAARTALEAGCADDDLLVRRAALNAWLRVAPAAAIACAIADPNAHTRLWGVRELMRRSMDTANDTSFEQLLHDRFMPVRRCALEALLARADAAVPPLLRDALRDPHVSMREFARSEITRRGGREDLGAVYRGLLANPSNRVLAVAVAGLGETGTRDDAALLKPFLSHSVPAMRRIALVAMDRLDAQSTALLLHDALTDPSIGVARTAARLLGRPGHSLDAGRLGAMMRSEPRAANRSVVVVLLNALSRWEALSLLVEACGDADAGVVSVAHRSLEVWLNAYNQSFNAPTRAQRVAIADALGTHDHSVPESTRHQLRSLLATW